MPYLSDLLNNKVLDSGDKLIGRVADVLIKPIRGEYPPLEFLIVKINRQKKFISIPYSLVENFTLHEVSLANQADKIGEQEIPVSDFIKLKEDVLDQQIVDVAGVRVVRVNDLKIGVFNNQMCILGIDVSFEGLLRRLGLEWLDFFHLLKVHLIDWRETRFIRRFLKLDTISQDLNRLHPADLANIIEDLNVRHGTRLVKALDAQDAANVLEEIDPHLKRILVKYLEPEHAAKILMQMPVNETADLIKMMPKGEAKLFLSYLRDTKLKQIEELVAYAENSAGGLMTVDFTSVRPDWTVAQAIEEVKKTLPSFHSILYVYITDEDGKYFGKFSLRWLLLSKPETKVTELLKNYPLLPTLRSEQKINEIANIMTKYDLLTVPVLNKQGKMIGVVNIDDIMRRLMPKA